MRVPLAWACILFSAVVGAIPAVFMQNVISVIEQSWAAGNWAAVQGQILRLVSILLCFYVLSLVSTFVWNRMMAIITQGFLCKLRKKMFDQMQDLPIKYFDTHNHGDIMSYYTNDIDTLRQMVSQSIPSLLAAVVTIASVLAIMLYYSVWLTLVVLAGVVLMFFVTKKVGGGSAKYFIRQQKAIGRTEGYIEEIMNGQKVVKVFCHEDASKSRF